MRNPDLKAAWLALVVATSCILGVAAKRPILIVRKGKQPPPRRYAPPPAVHLNPACYLDQECVAGTCLGSTPYTSSTGCGTDALISISYYEGDGCYDTPCLPGGCKKNETQLASSWCGVAYSERCCRTARPMYACRKRLPCLAAPYRGPPPRPFNGVPYNGVPYFSPQGAFVANATTDLPVNVYAAAILAWASYETSYGSDGEVKGIEVFNATFHQYITVPMGGNRTWTVYGKRSTDYVMIDTPTCFFVSFRGTEGLKDVFTDYLSSETASIEVAGVPVLLARGFYDAFVDNVDEYIETLTKFRANSTNPDKPLWITGHSLGAALAQLFAAYTHIEVTPVQGVIAFAAPMVGGPTWRSVYPLNNVTYRYGAPSDPVPAVPCFFGSQFQAGVLRTLNSCPASDAYFAAQQAPPSEDGGGRRRMQALSAANDAVDGGAVADGMVAAAVAAFGSRSGRGRGDGAEDLGGSSSGGGGGGGGFGSGVVMVGEFGALHKEWVLPRERGLKEGGRLPWRGGGRGQQGERTTERGDSGSSASGSGDGAGEDGDGDGNRVSARGVWEGGNALRCVLTSCCGDDCDDVPDGTQCFGLDLIPCKMCLEPGYDASAHSSRQYAAKVYFCMLSDAERSRVPAWTG